ncbi:DUF2834 domain-containing protein [Photobacterium sp. MCCC 1A19761]|uniref:DUF2834 domain-containing protein n=1 Tax=Photobacterium sp. MCCC 1A19761 TaxID=3115000 RepID=UPI00307EA7D7
MARTYLIFTILGILLPYGAFLPWLMTHGLDVIRLIQDAIANPISIFAWLDVVVAALALATFIVTDGKAHGVRFRWLALIGTFTVGVSCGLPLYLYLKEKQQGDVGEMQAQRG